MCTKRLAAARYFVRPLGSTFFYIPFQNNISSPFFATQIQCAWVLVVPPQRVGFVLIEGCCEVTGRPK